MWTSSYSSVTLRCCVTLASGGLFCLIPSLLPNRRQREVQLLKVVQLTEAFMNTMTWMTCNRGITEHLRHWAGQEERKAFLKLMRLLKMSWVIDQYRSRVCYKCLLTKYKPKFRSLCTSKYREISNLVSKNGNSSKSQKWCHRLTAVQRTYIYL